MVREVGGSSGTLLGRGRTRLGLSVLAAPFVRRFDSGEPRCSSVSSRSSSSSFRLSPMTAATTTEPRSAERSCSGCGTGEQTLHYRSRDSPPSRLHSQNEICVVEDVAVVAARDGSALQGRPDATAAWWDQQQARRPQAQMASVSSTSPIWRREAYYCPPRPALTTDGRPKQRAQSRGMIAGHLAPGGDLVSPVSFESTQECPRQCDRH